MTPVNHSLYRLRNAFLCVVMCITMFSAGYLFRHTCVRDAAESAAVSIVGDELQYDPEGPQSERWVAPTIEELAIDGEQELQEPQRLAVEEEPTNEVLPVSYEEPALNQEAVWEGPATGEPLTAELSDEAESGESSSESEIGRDNRGDGFEAPEESEGEAEETVEK